MTIELPYTAWLKEQGWIHKGDCVYVVSDMLELGKVCRNQGNKLVLNELIVALQDMVGDEGTLLFPTFNWDFCKGIAFDIKNTPVKTGALPKAALKREDFQRTAHPLYSFAVWGKHSKELLKNNARDAFGPGTIFEKMYEWNAKVLVIGLSPLAGVTYIHHVEQMVGVPYRYNKEFTADYIDVEGNCSVQSYFMYVRDLDMDPRHINGFQPLADKMTAEGKIQSADFNSVQCHFLLVSDLDEAVRRDILENDSRNMYHVSSPRT